MSQSLFDHNSGAALEPIHPLREMGAYEALWLSADASFKSIAKRFAALNRALPSSFVSREAAEQAYRTAFDILQRNGVRSFGIRIHGAGDYPNRLRDAQEPVELLYYQGAWELADSPSVAIVGTRKPSSDGLKRAERVASLLVKEGYTIASGLAEGIDTAAHTAAIKAGGNTIAVIGTPIGEIYPKKNARLQSFIARDHLVISQVPIIRYSQQSYLGNRLFFPERNKTMSALTTATVIIEAGETSGTLTQARAALYQGRKLLLLDNLFQRNDIKWPHRFLEQGAIRVRNIKDILEQIGTSTKD